MLDITLGGTVGENLGPKGRVAQPNHFHTDMGAPF